MKLLVHDYSGHPFQAQLSRALVVRGHDVVHSTCTAYVSGKGDLDARDTPGLRFETIGRGPVKKHDFLKRTVQELTYGFELSRQISREKPDVVLVSNAPVPTLLIAALFMLVRRVPWVLWHQDVQAVALDSFAGNKLGKIWHLAARVLGVAERWCSRRAAHIVVIAESFVAVHESWGTADKVSVIPNWAPLDEIVPTPRDNAWSREHDLTEPKTLLYSGMLGLKHDPVLLVELTGRVRELGVDARLVVVNTGPAEGVVREAAARLDVPLTYLPFQPYERLSEVLGSGDVLVVLLERSAGAFSVPSKTLSYLCAGRPVVGLMPHENLASQLLERAGCAVLPPDTSSIDAAAKWVATVLTDDTLQAELASQTRQLAESEFALEGCADRFEQILVGSARRAVGKRAPQSASH
ncbi:MAG TPA: glycosyltransferase family 4 protein [Nocardioidaceae bacterium]|nr:glycosyltransferase family 4 protein [Nocardioidaceae bacterium]